MKQILLSVLLVFAWLAPSPAANGIATSGSKPQWVSKGEGPLNKKRSGTSYYFKRVHAAAATLDASRQVGLSVLADYIGTTNHITGHEQMTFENHVASQNDVRTRETFKMVVSNERETRVFYAVLVDEYWTMDMRYSGAQQYQYDALYAVSENNAALPDRFEVTRTYGALPTVLSVVPGAGQLYKGSTVKGVCLLGAAAVGVGTALYAENRRSYNATRIAEQPKFARDYSKRRDNAATLRNIAIGATGALVVYSVLDAALTPGATRVKVSPRADLSFRPAPLVTPLGTGAGLALALTF